MACIGKLAAATAARFIEKSLTVVAPVVIATIVIPAIFSPIVLLWHRTIDKGFSVVITVLLLLLDVVLLYPIVTNAAGNFSINPRELIREVKENRKKNRMIKKKAKRQRKQRLQPDP